MNLRLSLFVSIILLFFISGALGQSTPSSITKHDLSQAEIDRIIANFTKKEALFRQALNSYAYRRYATIHTIGFGGQITGEYRRDSFMTFKDNGERIEKILFNPISTISDITITPTDIDDLGGVNPFAIDPSVAPLYNFTYLGKEKVDELDLYVFDVAPKEMPNPKKSKLRVFTGRVWVDDVDYQIVRTKGKAGPETKNDKYPTVETWRENVDGKYWFPTYATCNDEIVFDNGSIVRLKMRVRYVDYQPGRSEVKILDDEVVVEETPKPTPSPTTPPKKP